MAQISLAAAGNAEKNVNLINARFQAEALRQLRGYDVGVLDNSFYTSADPRGLNRDKNEGFMWKLTASNVLDIAVGRGMATAYGYDAQSESNVHLTATAPATGKKYLFVYIQWNLSNPVEAIGSLEIYDNGSSASWAPPRQDNLITNPMGIYQLPLYRLEVNTSGSVTARADWKSLGVMTIGRPLAVENAQNSVHADQADNATKVNNYTVDFDNSGALCVDEKITLQKIPLWSGSLVLYNTASKGTQFSLSRGLSDGDVLEVVYEQQYSQYGNNHKAVILVPVTNSGFILTAVYSGRTKNNGFTATSDAFSVAGTTVTYSGGYYLLNFANNGGTTLENNAIRLLSVSKIVGL